MLQFPACQLIRKLHKAYQFDQWIPTTDQRVNGRSGRALFSSFVGDISRFPIDLDLSDVLLRHGQLTWLASAILMAEVELVSVERQVSTLLLAAVGRPAAAIQRD